MKVEIPQIHWHGDRDRIMSLDFYPNTNMMLTSGGEQEDRNFIKVSGLVYSRYGKLIIMTARKSQI